MYADTITPKLATSPFRRRRIQRSAIAGVTALAIGVGAMGAFTGSAEARPAGDRMYWCLKAGGNYMECWYNANFQM